MTCGIVLQYNLPKMDDNVRNLFSEGTRGEGHPARPRTLYTHSAKNQGKKFDPKDNLRLLEKP